MNRPFCISSITQINGWNLVKFRGKTQIFLAELAQKIMHTCVPSGTFDRTQTLNMSALPSSQQNTLSSFSSLLPLSSPPRLCYFFLDLASFSFHQFVPANANE